jgi:general secretion pathway protein I
MNMQINRRIKHHRPAPGFTLLEVLVALVIVGTALGASLRAVGSLTRNSEDLRGSMMATWSAENKLTQIRLGAEFPDVGETDFPCPQADLQLVCHETVFATPNPFFRRIEISVANSLDPERSIVKLHQLVPR